MMGRTVEDKDFVIQIKGLRPGKHYYEFNVGESLFEEFGNTQILNADVCVKIELEKGAGWMKVTDSSSGSVTVECDRCLEELSLPVDFTATLSVRFAKGLTAEDDSQDDETIVIDSTDGELDLKQFIYDYICLNLPITRVHKEGECNSEMLDRLEKSGGKGESTDANLPFAGLDKLLDNK